MAKLQYNVFVVLLVLSAAGQDKIQHVFFTGFDSVTISVSVLDKGSL